MADNMVWFSALSYLLLTALFYFVFWVWFPTKLRRFKIQEVVPERRFVTYDFWWSIASIIFVSFFLPMKSLIQNTDSNIWVTAILFILMILVDDFLRYWIHRGLHVKWFYKKIHYVHHHSKISTPWTNTAVHPIEGVLFVLPVMLLKLIFPMPTLVFFAYLSFVKFQSLLRHLGYDFLTKPLSKIPILRSLCFGIHHEPHHTRVSVNYASIFIYWDKWMGTLRMKI